MVVSDLRGWLGEVERLGRLKKIDGADWDIEIGCLSALNVRKKDSPVLLFDRVKGYPAGYRVVSCTTSNASTMGLTFNLPTNYSDMELMQAMRRKLLEWEASLNRFPPEVVETGPILENVLSGDDVDLFKFPTPKWHELDGGRYVGTGDAVVTQDPDTGETNLGTYRVMIHDRKTMGLYISPGHHGRIHYEKYHAQGKPCPVAVSIGHHPLIFRIACAYVPLEYNFIGAIRGEPVKVIKEEITGLPIPADSEIVIAGWCPPGKTRSEGPFGEWTGYYASKTRPLPIIEVERIYHRNDPIILGSPPNRIPSDYTYYGSIMRSAMIHNELVKNDIPDVRGVWTGEAPSAQFIVVSIKQRYAGHATRAGLIASQCSSGAYAGRYVIVVDEDIDPSNIRDVLWALCSRSDPEKDIEIIRRCWSSGLDTTIRKPATAFFNSKAIIYACKPFDWKDEFPQAIEISPEFEAMARKKWSSVLDL